jgi:ComF family protein
MLDVLFPWACLGCGRDGSSPFCPPCLGRVRWIDGAVCDRCGLPLASGPSHSCGRCLRRPPAFARARSIACYRTTDEEVDPLGACLRALKYGRRRPLARPLAELLADRFPFHPADFDLAVAVPLHRERLLLRGFNQALLLARGPARRFGIPLGPRVLARVRPTAPQVGLDEAARRQNLRGAFAVATPRDVADRRVLLVDDVCTSTATAEACARALLDAGARSVDVLTVARTLYR